VSFPVGREVCFCKVLKALLYTTGGFHPLRITSPTFVSFGLMTECDNEDDGFGPGTGDAHSVASSGECPPPPELEGLSNLLKDFETQQTSVVSKRKLEQDLDSDMARSVNSEWETLLDSAIIRTDSAGIKLPWDYGFAKNVFGKPLPAFLEFKPPTPRYFDPSSSSTAPPQVSEPEAIVKRVDAVPGAWKVIAQRLGHLKFHQSEVSSRQVALGKIKRILLMAPESCKLGRKLLTQLMSFQHDGFLDQVLTDVFAAKATATISKRSGHLLDYADYCVRTKQQFLPLDESMFYEYLVKERAVRSATAAKSAKESIAFGWGTLGLDGAESIINSERICGLCHRMQLHKRPTKRATVLTRKQVICLERTLMNPDCDGPDRVMAGHSLWATFGRLRWRDSLYPSSIQVDINEYGEGYCEAQTLISKTSTTAQKKTTYLPQVAPANGLETANWPAKWLKLRQQYGLPEPGTVNAEGEVMALITKVNSSGNFSSEPLSASEATRWLQEILVHSLDAPIPPLESVKGNTSHCLKATTLSWVSKHGSIEGPDRKLLGGHVDQSECSMLTYSRDALAKPLRLYVKVLDDVASGKFNPDSTRSGYFIKERPGSVTKEVPTKASEDLGFSDFQLVQRSGDVDAETAVANNEEVAEPCEKVDAIDSEPSPSEQSSSDSSENPDPILKSLHPIATGSRAVALRSQAAAFSGERVFHLRLKTLHAVHKDDETKLACGRQLHEGFMTVDANAPLGIDDFPKCSICFGTRNS
jgi:hypothetical protein